jgi:hypothetical protein
VGVRDRINILTRRAAELDVVRQVEHQLFHVLAILGLDVEIDHADQALDVRTAQQRAAHDGHLLFHVGEARHAGHERLEHALGIHIHTGGSLVFIGHREDNHGPGNEHQPGHDRRPPPVFPDPLQRSQNLIAQLFH